MFLGTTLTGLAHRPAQGPVPPASTPEPPLPVVPPRPAVPVVPPRPAVPVVPAMPLVPPRPALPVVPPRPAVPVVPPLPALPVVPAAPVDPTPAAPDKLPSLRKYSSGPWQATSARTSHEPSASLRPTTGLTDIRGASELSDRILLPNLVFQDPLRLPRRGTLRAPIYVF